MTEIQIDMGLDHLYNDAAIQPTVKEVMPAVRKLCHSINIRQGSCIIA